MKTCMIPGCGRPHEARNLCRGHYQRLATPLGLRPEIPLYRAKDASLNPNWKGGVTIWEDGRYYILSTEHPKRDKRGYVARYRLIMEQKIGRHLERHEIVHHINGNKADDRLENLQLVTSSEHARIHARERREEISSFAKSRPRHKGRFATIGIPCKQGKSVKTPLVSALLKMGKLADKPRTPIKQRGEQT